MMDVFTVRMDGNHQNQYAEQQPYDNSHNNNGSKSSAASFANKKSRPSNSASSSSSPPSYHQHQRQQYEGIFSKCSTKCLIAFTICAIALVVLSSIFMAIVTTSVLVRSSTHPSGLSHRELLRQNLEKYLMGSINESGGGQAQPATNMDPNMDPNTASSTMPNNDGNDSSSSGASNKLERNVFSWITDTIKKSFMTNSGEKKSSHSLPASFANMFGDMNGDLLMNVANEYNNNNNNNNNNGGGNGANSMSGNPSFDQIIELTRRFRLDECGVASIKPHAVKTRIMNGKEAKPNSWPWAVSIGLEGPREYVPHACGGTLINRRYVITAAHCVIQNSVFGLVGGPVRSVDKYSSVERMMRIYVGVHDRLTDISSNRIYSVEKITIHQDFDPVTFKNDLAIIRLDRDIDPSNQVGFVCLTGRVQGGQVTPGDTIYAIGWGYTEKSKNQASRYLMQVDLVVQRKENCLIQYIDNDQFCAGNIYERKDTCNGDSGGPLLKLVNKRWTLVGVVSNGDVTCSGTGIYINVPYFYDWIVNNSH